MAFMRFIVGLLGFGLLIGGTICAILGFYGVSRGDPDGWKQGALGVVAVVVGGALTITPPRVRP